MYVGEKGSVKQNIKAMKMQKPPFLGCAGPPALLAHMHTFVDMEKEEHGWSKEGEHCYHSGGEDGWFRRYLGKEKDRRTQSIWRPPATSGGQGLREK